MNHQDHFIWGFILGTTMGVCLMALGYYTLVI